MQFGKEFHNFDKIGDDLGFSKAAMELFRFQAQHNSVYKTFLSHINCNPLAVNGIEHIPFLPISLFTTQTITTGEFIADQVFESSKTTGTVAAKHHLASLQLYRKSFIKGFELAYGNPLEYKFLCLLPSYLERQNSSLVYMFQHLVSLTEHLGSNFYLYNHEELLQELQKSKETQTKTILLGVSFALLDIVDNNRLNVGESTIVMETGGMKGRRKELIRQELHEVLCNGFGVSKIHSEYGMTELLSQAYSKGEGIFSCPPWMKLCLRDVYDPQSLLPPTAIGKTGAVNIIDLANVYSCAFIATNDLGRCVSSGEFEILGRIDNADVRGCNLMV
jgi:hypothetical protein